MKHADSKIFLHPGDFCFTREKAHMHTLLGSCISITLWHPTLCIGGMCHFVLPKYKGEDTSGRKLDGRYADDAMRMFVREIVKSGTTLNEYEAKIFGGGNMIRSDGQEIEDTIGSKNSAAAMELLMQENANIQVVHVGEFGHRRIVFDVGTGDVWVRFIEKEGTGKVRLSGVA